MMELLIFLSYHSVMTLSLQKTLSCDPFLDAFPPPHRKATIYPVAGLSAGRAVIVDEAVENEGAGRGAPRHVRGGGLRLPFLVGCIETTL
jgi:hypothetical protein